ncbi:hypothetical protein B484DRAFT_460148, partial [Ochromonadaceae sp. CCMP2298]
MGCGTSMRKRIGTQDSKSVQDEAKSFRSKVDAIRWMTRNIHSRHAFQVYLEETSSLSDYLICFMDLDEIKAQQSDAATITHTVTTLNKYEEKSSAEGNTDGKVTNLHTNTKIWERLGRLRSVDLKHCSRHELLACVTVVQDQILAELAAPFERFLQSALYRDWKAEQMASERDSKNAPQVGVGRKPIFRKPMFGKASQVREEAPTEGVRIRHISGRIAIHARVVEM